MLRVRDEMGPDARIVRAERVRTGGIAGFFAKEHYELTVEVPEKPRRKLGRTRPAPPATDGGGGGSRGEPVGIDALMAAAEEAERTPVSTASDSFAQVLASVQQMVGPVDGTGGDAGDEDHAGAGAVAGDGDGRSGVGAGAGWPGGAGDASAPADAAASWLPAAFPVLPMGDAPPPPPVATDADADGGSPQARAPGAPAAVPGDGVRGDGMPGDTALSETADRPDTRPPGAAALDGAAPEAAAPEAAALDAGEEVRPRSCVASLLELGIPTRLLAGFTDPYAPVALSRLVRTFDRPRGVRLAPGALVVVAGPPELALRTATQMAHRAGLVPQDVVLAGDVDPIPGHGRRITTAAAAARVRERAVPDAPTVVALGVGGTGAAAELLAAFAPDEAWAALDARLRGVELRRWLRAVGSRRAFDAVAALNAFEAQAPGTVLNLGVPVGWVDGLPASPVVWAAVLSERLADDARWD